MQLDYIHHINEYDDNMVRLYGFGREEACLFAEVVERDIIMGGKEVFLSDLDFIEARNCHLTLRIADEDLGIETDDGVNFFCGLTKEGYEEMLRLLQPFCSKDTKGYQWLYDIDSQTDFLFSPAGTW